MPTLLANRCHWLEYDWTDGGNEWSEPWGGVQSQWHMTVLPRIHRFLPAATVLEIAAGHGRWTQFLRRLCKHLVVVDLSPTCIETCRTRFGAAGNIEYHITDGLSLPMVPDQSIDFVFSYDSLVHADMKVMSAYLSEVARVLTPTGAAFMHHSNLGEYAELLTAVSKYQLLGEIAVKFGFLDGYLHWRDPHVSSLWLAEAAASRGLVCIVQELVHWRTQRLMIDCFSTVVRRGSPLARRPVVIRNLDFMNEVRAARTLAALYGPVSEAHTIDLELAGAPRP